MLHQQPPHLPSSHEQPQNATPTPHQQPTQRPPSAGTAPLPPALKEGCCFGRANIGPTLQRDPHLKSNPMRGLRSISQARGVRWPCTWPMHVAWVLARRARCAYAHHTHHRPTVHPALLSPRTPTRTTPSPQHPAPSTTTKNSVFAPTLNHLPHTRAVLAHSISCRYLERRN